MQIPVKKDTVFGAARKFCSPSYFAAPLVTYKQSERSSLSYILCCCFGFWSNWIKLDQNGSNFNTLDFRKPDFLNM
jgi:hypothetical protein